MKKEETICAQALRILKPIPENKWTTGSYVDINNNQRCCALGHLNRKLFKRDYANEKEMAIREATCKYLKSIGIEAGSIVHVNDGKPLTGKKKSNKLYSSIGPKQRVILFLKDAVAAGY